MSPGTRRTLVAKQPTVGGGAVRKIETVVLLILALVNGECQSRFRRGGAGAGKRDHGSKFSCAGGTAVVGWVERMRDPTPSHANLDVGSRQELDATYGLSANVAMPARTRASNSSNVLPTGSLPPVLRCSFCKCVVVAVSYRSGFALTRTATHQYHLKSGVPSPIKRKRCRMVTARRGPKLYHSAIAFGESGGWQ